MSPQCYSCLLGWHIIFNLTLCTNLFSSQYLCMTLTHLPIIPGVCFLQDHNVSKLQVLFSIGLFLPFVKRLQQFFPPATPKFITMCWTFLHLLQLYKSGLEKSLGGGKIILDFMAKRFDGDRGKLLVDH